MIVSFVGFDRIKPRLHCVGVITFVTLIVIMVPLVRYIGYIASMLPFKLLIIIH